jgi:hypothetical protein
MTSIADRLTHPIRLAVLPVALLFSVIGSLAMAQTDQSAQTANSNELADAIAEAANSTANTDGAEPEFRLFEAIDSAATADSPRNRRTRNATATRNTIANPEFTLVGTSRIGDKYSVILTHKDGNTVVVQAEPNTRTEIMGHSQFSIGDVGSRVVSINYPDGTNCVESKDKGVSCNTAANTANLTLTYGEPLAPRQRQVSEPVQAFKEAIEGEEDEPVNPFAALRDAAETNGGSSRPANGDGNTSQFRPRRIDPDDVPPGQRVVSTPFGDRLVDQ